MCFALQGRKCAACGETNRVQVHHLTYVHIFDELDNELLPLCGEHHRKIEELIEIGKITRRGDPIILKKRTLKLLAGVDDSPNLIEHNRLIMAEKRALKAERRRQRRERNGAYEFSRKRSTFTVKKVEIRGWVFEVRNAIQEKLLSEEWFLDAVPLVKKKFGAIVRKMAGSRGKINGDCFSLYNRARKSPSASIPHESVKVEVEIQPPVDLQTPHRGKVNGINFRNEEQLHLLSEQWFLDMLALDRESFKKEMNVRFGGVNYNNRTRANCFAIYDRSGSCGLRRSSSLHCAT